MGFNSGFKGLTDRLLPPLFTIVSMDSCEEDAIIACGLFILWEKGKRVKRTFWIHNVFRAREKEEEFHTLNVWRMPGKTFSNILEWVFRNLGRSQWPRGLRRRSAAARLLRLWVRIPPGAWIFVCCECSVLSCRVLYDELIARPDESYQLWCVVVCDLETSRMRRPWPALRRSATEKKSKFEILKQLLPTHHPKTIAQWRSSITTEEWLALTIRLAHKNV